MAADNNINPGELSEAFYGNNPTELPVSAVSAQATLAPGFYKMLGDVEFWFLQGDNPTATTSSNRVPAGVYYPIKVVAGKAMVACIAGGDGTVQFQRAGGS